MSRANSSVHAELLAIERISGSADGLGFSEASSCANAVGHHVHVATLQGLVCRACRVSRLTLGEAMPGPQTFVDRDATGWIMIDVLPGVTLLPLAQPVKDGSIHRARLSLGTVIPAHAHPADEYVMVLSGTVETGGRRCEAGTFWITPAGTRQGPHVAITDVELLTMRLGAMGPFES